MAFSYLTSIGTGKPCAKIMYAHGSNEVIFLFKRLTYKEERSPFGFVTLFKKPRIERLVGFRINRLRELLALNQKEEYRAEKMHAGLFFNLIRQWLGEHQGRMRIKWEDYDAEKSLVNKLEQKTGGYNLQVPKEHAESLLFYLSPP